LGASPRARVRLSSLFVLVGTVRRRESDDVFDLARARRAILKI